MTLADMITPLSVDRFLQDYIGRDYLLQHGAVGRFQGLLSWSDLEDALSHLRVDDNRVVLVQNAQGVSRDSYVQASQNGRNQYLIGPAVLRHVLNGATLVVNQVDELFQPVRQLAESCEDTFGIYVPANLYAGWRRDRGFDVHIDSHDTLILQIEGRKDWKVWAPTRLHPIDGDGHDLAPPPSGEPLWEGVLEAGTFLYMPRGWWHVATPRDEPSLHVTLGVRHKRGADVLDWALTQARQTLSAREDVPHWRPREDQRAWIASLRQECLGLLQDDVIERYLVSLSERAHTRPIVRLPRTSLVSTAPTIDHDTSLRLVRGSQLNLRRDPGGREIVFSAQNKEWRCHGGLAPALELLNHLRPCTLAAMESRIDGRSKSVLRAFIVALAIGNVVWADSVPECESRLHVPRS